MATKARSDVITLVRVNDGATGPAGRSYWVSHEWIDVSASTYDQDTYYPVVGSEIPRNGTHRIKTSVQLNSGTKPKWSRHNDGFSVDLDIQTQASGWGTTHAVTYILLDDYDWCVSGAPSPVSFVQKSEASAPVLYLRGGGKYCVETTYSCSWSIKTSEYYTHQGTTGIGPKGPVSPTKTRPAVEGKPIKGEDGISPTVSVSKTGSTTTISITDKNGTHTQTVLDGVNGTPGAKGADGRTTYFHVKYSNDGGKTFTSNSGETVGTYIGTCTDYNSADPTAVGAYTWAKIKGEIGDSVSSITEEYYLSASNTSQTGGSWATTPQSYVSGRYYWTRSHIVYKKADGSTYSGYTTPVLAQAINSANETADTALASANGKGKSYYQAAQPSSGKDGDLWFKLDSSGNAIGIYKYNGKAWVAMPIESDVIASLEAAKINAGTLNGMKIVGSTFVTPWKYYEKRVTGIDFALVYTGYSRIRITNDGIFFDNFIKRFDSDDDPTDSTSPTSYFQFYFGTDDSLWLEDVNGGLQRVLLDSYDGLDAGVTIHSGSGSVAFNSGDSATPTKILNKNYFGEPVNSMPIGDGSAHTISFGWTGRLRPVIDGNQIYMPVLDTIFYDPNNGMGSGVSLTSAATDYDALDVFCKTDDGVQIYTKVCNPKVGTTFEVSVNHMNAGGGHMWMKTKQFIIDGESHISTAHSGANWYTGILRIDSNSTPTAVSVGDYITIIKVVGWKY